MILVIKNLDTETCLRNGIQIAVDSFMGHTANWHALRDLAEPLKPLKNAHNVFSTLDNVSDIGLQCVQPLLMLKVH